MRIYLLSSDKKIISVFENTLERSLYHFEVLKETTVQNCFKKMLKGSLVYIDIQSQAPEELIQLMQYLPRLDNYNYAIVDIHSKIKDPGALFLNGASDYISKTALSKDLDIRRFKKAIEFYPLEIEEEKQSIPFSGSDWTNIKPEHEYTFCFLFIKLEMKEDWKLKSGKDLKQVVKQSFYKHIESEVNMHGGRVWIRDEFKQIALFPYNGSDCKSIILPISLLLNRLIFSAEKYSFDDIMEFTMCFHIGNTLYKEFGQTGDIISDDINLIHHLPTAFGEKGNLYITQNAVPYIPEGLMHLFEKPGQYKHLDIYRMKQPLLH